MPPDSLLSKTLAELARLAFIVESSDDAILSEDLNGTILTWNRGAAAIYGYSAEEAVGRSTNLLVPLDRAAEEEAILARIRAGLRIQHFETIRIKKSGVAIEVSLTISPILDEENRVVGASHVARDISERRRLEVANAQLAAIVESSEDAIISKDLAGTIKSWNAKAERIYGYSVTEALGKSMKFLQPSGQEQEEDEILEKINRGERVDHFETVRAKKDGSLVQVSLTISPIRDRAGAVIGVSHIAREITEQRWLEAANAQLAAIIESSEDAIVSKDLNGTIQTWNAGAERIYGYAMHEAIGRNIAFLLPSNRVNEEQAILSKLRAGHRVEHFETTRLRKDGQLIEVSLSVSPIRNVAGSLVGASHVARDITKRRELEAQLRQTQRLESIGVLAGGIAHDFNNLLTGIIGNASLVADSLPASHPAQERLEDLTAAADRAADLTRQMLAYSGRGQFVIEAVDVSGVVAEISKLIKASIPKTVAVRLEPGANVPRIEGDPNQIQQLVMNMIINAAEAIGESRSGTVVVRTGAQQMDEPYLRALLPAANLTPGEYVYIDVRDDGCGMDEETKARIFDPFFTTKFAGRGLGLAAALGIVNSHKGAISVESTPGEGTNFKVFLPAMAPRSPVGGEPDLPPSKGTILVADDEEMVRKVAKLSLESYGYRVVLASNGKEAIDVLREMSQSIDLIVLDLTMPIMGGEEAFEHLRAVRADVPIVLSSGYNETEATRRFAIGGIAGFVQKPYRSIKLREIVDAVIAQRAMPSEP
jgi:two-component system cell cycle sensor histidine kinase/response regulator CckA